jgi:hypothetical protein
MYKPFRALFLFSLIVIGVQVQAQQLSNSPYSRYGVGDMVSGTTSVRSSGMGYVGVGTANGQLINDQNPALLFYNNLVTFEAAVATELKNISDRQNSQIDGTGSLGHLTIAIPLSRRWTTAFGLKPYSRVNYLTYLSEPLRVGEKDVTILREYKGTGGLSEVFFSHGIRIATGLTAGVTASYLFGTIDREATSILVDPNDSTNIPQKAVVHTGEKYAGLAFKGGMHYRKKFSDKISMGLGATYAAKANLSSDYQASLERRLLDDFLLSSIVTDSTEGYSTIPQTYQIGLGLDNNKNWSAGIDYTASTGSDFRGFSREKGQGPQELGDSYRFGAGAEFTPDPASVSSYFKRVTYRFGGFYGNSEILAANTTQELNNMGVTWGFSFPVGRGVRPPDYTQAVLNTSFVIGMQDAPSTGIKEQYFRFNIGVTFNNRWFIKRRFD